MTSNHFQYAFTNPVHISFKQSKSIHPSISTQPVTYSSPIRHSSVKMVSISRPSAKDYNFEDDRYENNSTTIAASHPISQPTSPEVVAVAATVCEFMNKEHVRDIASYVIQFGKKFDDLSQLTAVRMTGLDATGFTTDIVSCDSETSQCVCVQERLDWPLGLCHSANDIITALKHLSMLCGLPADF